MASTRGIAGPTPWPLRLDRRCGSVADWTDEPQLDCLARRAQAAVPGTSDVRDTGPCATTKPLSCMIPLHPETPRNTRPKAVMVLSELGRVGLTESLVHQLTVAKTTYQECCSVPIYLVR